MAKQTWLTVRRLILAAELRRLRKESGESRKDVEQACDLGTNTLYKYENGNSSMSAVTARRLFEHYDVNPEHVDDLVAIAKSTRRHNIVQSEHDALSDVPEWFNLFVMLEQEASKISSLALILIPGLLQTRRYMTSVLRAGVYGADVEHFVETRMARKAVLTGEAPVKLWAILHESALLRAIGGPEVMAEQLTHLTEIAKQSNVTIQVIPNEFGSHVCMTNSFDLFRYRIAPKFGVVYTEHLDGAMYWDDPERVDLHDATFQHLIKAALPEEQSMQRIMKIRKEHYA